MLKIVNRDKRSVIEQPTHQQPASQLRPQGKAHQTTFRLEALEHRCAPACVDYF